MKTPHMPEALLEGLTDLRIVLITADKIEATIIQRILQDTRATLTVFDQVLGAAKAFLTKLPDLVVYSLLNAFEDAVDDIQLEVDHLQSYQVPLLVVIDHPDWDRDKINLERVAGYISRPVLGHTFLTEVRRILCL